MLWLDEAVEVLRILINDVSTSPEYTDELLEQTILVAAKYVAQEINLDNSYTVNFLTATVTPDPTDDAIFINMCVMKAACQVSEWQARTKIKQDGIAARLGPAQLTIKNNNDIVLSLFKYGVCATYETLKQQHNFGNINIKGILSPFISNNFLPNNDYNGR